MRNVKQSKYTKKPTIFALSLLTLALNQVVYAEDATAQPEKDTVTELTPIQIRASQDVEAYTSPNASTALKTDTPVMETPFSIQVVPQQVLQDQQAYRLEDVVKNVSGMLSLPSPYSAAYETLQSRGFTSEPFRDGQRIMFLTVPLANAERVEILKGSAAIQYGRVEPGGMVNVVTKKPSATPHYEIQQQVGTDSFYRTTADLTGPINEDKTLMYRLNAEYLNTDSFVDYAFDKRTFIAPSLTWQPAVGTKVTLAYEHRNEKEQAATGVPVIGKRPSSVSIRKFYGEPNLQNHFKADVLNLSGEHQFNDQWTIRGGIGAYRGNYKYANVVNSSLAADNVTLSRWGLGSDYDHRNTEDAYIDVQGKFDTAGIKHTVLVGTDYHRFRNYANWADWALPDININNPVYGLVSKAAIDASPVTAWWNRTDKWNGIYFQDQLTIANDWHLLLGGRYDRTDMSNGFAGTSMADAKAATITKHEKEFSPKVGLTYKATDWLSVYGSYTEAFGGWANTGLTATGKMLDPESSKQYEVGGKTELFDGKLMASVALYELTKQNLATADLANPGFSLSIGEAKSKGIEFDVSGKISNNLSIIANAAFNDVTLTKDNNGNQGNRLANTPHSSGGVWLKYAFSDDVLQGLSVGGGVFAASSSQGDNANSFKLPGYVRLDTYAAYKMKLGEHQVTAQINVNNLLDKTYYPTAQGPAQAFAAEPLKATASLKFEY
ncbi:MAG TPA: TonB-dependent siderophore receptor [Methylophilaceae bacterium]|nr:TonB-dependent siderophore receptor [Methylophilaceae bacterium]